MEFCPNGELFTYVNSRGKLNESESRFKFFLIYIFKYYFSFSFKKIFYSFFSI